MEFLLMCLTCAIWLALGWALFYLNPFLGAAYFVITFIGGLMMGTSQK